MRLFFKIARYTTFGLLLWIILALGSCAPARTILQQADLTPALYPPARLDDVSASFKSLEQAIYGDFVAPTNFDLRTSEIISKDWLNGKASVERRIYDVSHGQPDHAFEVIFVSPNDHMDAPIILSQNFSPNAAVISINGHTPLVDKKLSMGPLAPIFTFFFGRHIVEPPLEDIIDRGYSFVAMHPPDYLADHADKATTQLNFMLGDNPERSGALMVWASLSTALADEFKAKDPSRPIITFGHSRYGKTALLAGAYSGSIDAVIAHQSGTAGASLMRDDTGESLGQIVKNYPHWLKPAAFPYANSPKTLPTDSHALLAQLSPKPVLLGNARRDVWSDPEGSFKAAKWAANNTLQTFSATRLDDFIPKDNIAIWTRPGTHGVVKEDWPAFLEFLDAHFK